MPNTIEQPVPCPEESPARAAAALARLLAPEDNPTPRLAQVQALLNAFGGLEAVLDASAEKLVASGLLFPGEAMRLMAMQEVFLLLNEGRRPVIDSSPALDRFLAVERYHSGRSVTRALLLDRDSSLVADIAFAPGNGPLTFAARRVLMRCCLQHAASAVIIVRQATDVDFDFKAEAGAMARVLAVLDARLVDYVLVEIGLGPTSGLHAGVTTKAEG